MFATAAVLSTFFFFVAATHGGPSVSQCNTGDAQCCNQVVSNTHKDALAQAAALGIAVSDLTGQIGLGCKAVTVIGAADGTNCAQAPVCCQNNNFNGLINIGCDTIST